MSNKETKEGLMEEMMEALWAGDAEKLRELLRCPMTRAEMLVDAFNKGLLKDSAIAERKMREDAGYGKGVFKAKWINTPTKSIRVPLKFARDIMALAHRVDKGKFNPADVLDEEDYIHAQPVRARVGDA